MAAASRRKFSTLAQIGTSAQLLIGAWWCQ
jgi:hypothetical protein